MQSSNPASIRENKKLDIFFLYNDESLFDYFEFKSSFPDKINKTSENDFIYNKPFEDNDKIQFNIFNQEFYSNFNKNKGDLEINFGEEPYFVNKALMKKISNKFLDNNLKNKILKYWWSISNFCLFKYEGKNNYEKNKDNDNKTLNLNTENKIPYLYNNDYDNIFGDKCRALLRKNILPIKYINYVPVVIKDNQLLKKMIRKNKIIIINDVNIEQKKKQKKETKKKILEFKNKN